MKLITSGCSFSDNCYLAESHPGRWPQALSGLLGVELVNRGQGGAGNDWISRSAIYETSKALREGTPADDLLVLVMWSGMLRRSIFVSKTETANYEQIVNGNGMTNPASFIDYESTQRNSVEAGWMLGSITCSYENKRLNEWRDLYNQHFFTIEGAYIEALEQMLLLQYFLKKHNIRYVFLTYMDIIHPMSVRNYAKREYSIDDVTIPQHWPSVRHLWDELDLDQWLFWQNGKDKTLGLYEYCIDNGLSLESDNFHPTVESHRQYAKEFLLPNLSRRFQIP
jgi:hypothetical protein